MAGCYGSDSFDRHFERELDEYLGSQENEEFICEKCGSSDTVFNDSTNLIRCNNCGYDEGQIEE